MKKRKGAVFALVAAGVVAAFAGCVLNSGKAEDAVVPEFVLTYAENQAEDYPTTQGGYRFAELVRERTRGKVEILIEPDSVLGEEKDIIEQLKFGGVDFARVSLSPLADSIPVLNVLQMPYLYKDSDHMWRVLEGEIGDAFMKVLDGTGLIGLSWYDAGARSFYTSEKQICVLEDMQGLTIRVQESVLMRDTIEALGAKAVQMTFSQVYPALEKGEIDGAENNWPSYESMAHNEIARYFTVDEHTRIPELQLASAVTWEKLSEEYKQIILECAKESSLYERQLWKEQEELSKKRMLEGGCIVYELPEKERERFRDAVSVLYEDYYAEYFEIFEAIAEAGENK